MTPRATPRLLSVVALFLTAVAAAPVPQAQWRRLDSPNFIVIGGVGERQLREVALQFEGFKEVLNRLLAGGANRSAVPTVVYVFPSEHAFSPFRPRFEGKAVEADGVFMPRRDVNYISLIHDGNRSPYRVIFHEYAHLILEDTGLTIPVWLDEGLAEYYSTLQIGRGGAYAEIGHVIGSHLELAGGLATLRLPELLSVTHDAKIYNEGNRRSVFYAQSWALTHYILQSQPSLAGNLATYLADLGRGTPQLEAFTKAFGNDIAGALDRYIRLGSFTATQYKFADRFSQFDARAVPIPPADTLAYHADLLLELGQPTDAASRLADAARIDAASPFARVIRARSQGGANNADVAGDLGEMPPTGDWYHDYRAGVVISDAAEARQRPPTTEEIGVVRRLFAAQASSRGDLANALARVTALEIYSAGGPSKASLAAIERARALAPGRHDYKFLHAQVQARLGEFERAREILGPLMTPRYPSDIRQKARELMARVVELGSGSSRVDSTGTTIRPAFREVRPGEQRLEGLLESIECGANQSAAFHVKAGLETVTVIAAKLTDVDFVSYTTDFTGSVTCGQLKPALRVYVTWRPGTTPGSKVAVAIEFLPK